LCIGADTKIKKMMQKTIDQMNQMGYTVGMSCASLAINIKGLRVASGRRYHQSVLAAGQLMIFFN
jgi:hypothetical protein